MPCWRRSRRTTIAVWWVGGRGTKTAGYLARSSNKTCPQHPARSVNYRWLLIKITAFKIPDTAPPGKSQGTRHAQAFICEEILTRDCRVRVSGGLLQGFWILAVSASRSGFSRPSSDRKQQARFGQTWAAASGCAHTWSGAAGLESSHTSRSVTPRIVAEFALEETCTCHSSPRSPKH
jgi:hypothetical protein